MWALLRVDMWDQCLEKRLVKNWDSRRGGMKEQRSGCGSVHKSENELELEMGRYLGRKLDECSGKQREKWWEKMMAKRRGELSVGALETSWEEQLVEGRDLRLGTRKELWLETPTGWLKDSKLVDKWERMLARDLEQMKGNKMAQLWGEKKG
jgi:hypothetical protein